MTSLPEILDAIDRDGFVNKSGTQHLIYEAMLKIIGEDETLDMGGSYEAVQRHNASYDRNKRKATKRLRLKRFCFGDGREKSDE